MRRVLLSGLLVFTVVVGVAGRADAVPSPYVVRDRVGVANARGGDIKQMRIRLRETDVRIRLMLARGVDLRRAIEWTDGGSEMRVQLDGGGTAARDFRIIIRNDGDDLVTGVEDLWASQPACDAAVTQPGGYRFVQILLPRSCLVPGAHGTGPGDPPYEGEPASLRVRVGYDKNADGVPDRTDTTPDDAFTPAIDFPT